jgi:hypothetical protein
LEGLGRTTGHDNVFCDKVVFFTRGQVLTPFDVDFVVLQIVWGDVDFVAFLNEFRHGGEIGWILGEEWKERGVDVWFRVVLCTSLGLYISFEDGSMTGVGSASCCMTCERARHLNVLHGVY